MRLFKLSSIILFSLMLWVSCDNVQPDVQTTLTIAVPGEPAFPREIPTFPYEGKSLTVHVRTNQPSFTYTLSEDWVTCEQITSDSLRLTVPSYSGMGSRSAELVLTAGQGDLTVLRTFVIIQNSEFNQAFDIEDVDENGVLWFNSINKINKYLGADKLIVPVSAGHGTRETTIASDIFMGADTLGIIDGGDDSRMMGAIRLARASALGMVDDGGALEITVKSCSKLVVYLSSESSMRAGLRHNLGSGYENVALYGGMFQPNLSKSGQYIWACSRENDNKIVKGGEQTIRIFNMTNKYLYIHGIELLY